MDQLPSEQIRKAIVDELLTLRKEDKIGARNRLKEHKKEGAYQLAEALHRNREHISAVPDQRTFDEETGADEVKVAPYSNEPSLFETFEYIKNIEGVGLGVGLDQMFDIIVNSKLSEGYITDIAQKSVLTTRALLEAGRRFHELHHRYPSPQEYVALFNIDQLVLTFEMIIPAFTEEEWDIVEHVLGRLYKSGPLVMHSYLDYKATQPYYQSWLSTPENLEKIIRMYEDGRITVARGDIAGKTMIPQIGTHLKQNGSSISLLYLSNVTDFFMSEERQQPPESKRMKPIESFFGNIDSLPISDQTLVLHVTGLKGKNVTVPIPDRIQKDPNIHVMFGEWTYLVQSMRGYQTFMHAVQEHPDADPRSFIFQHIQQSTGNEDGKVQCYKPGVFLMDF